MLELPIWGERGKLRGENNCHVSITCAYAHAFIPHFIPHYSPGTVYRENLMQILVSDPCDVR